MKKKVILVTQLPKDKFIISKGYFNKRNKVYLWKITKRYAQWHPNKGMAKIFRYKYNAENIKTSFTVSEAWKIEKLN